MKNLLFTQAKSFTVYILVLTFTCIVSIDVYAHENHNESYNGNNQVYLTPLHQHTSDGKQHRHAIDNSLPKGVVHNVVELWKKHEHNYADKEWMTCPLNVQFYRGEVHTHDGRNHKHVVLYARTLDSQIASEILERLDNQVLDHSVESDVYTFQYVGQDIDGVDVIIHTHDWEHKHGDFGWHSHSAQHSHVYVDNEHPDWFSNDENNEDDNYPYGRFLNGHEVLHPLDNQHSSQSVSSQHKSLTLRWASLKRRS